MTVPLWCLFISMFIPYALAGVGVYYRSQIPGGADNKNPRTQAASLEGTGARAYAAQQNAWEALAVFTVAVVISHLIKGGPSEQASVAAVVFVCARLLHAVFYLNNLDKFRSLIFGVGMFCCVWMVVSSIR